MQKMCDNKKQKKLRLYGKKKVEHALENNEVNERSTNSAPYLHI